MTSSKFGECYSLGNHVLMCGDSTNQEHVDRLMDGRKGRMLFTSPPYSDMRTYSGNDVSVDVLKVFIKAYSKYVDYQCVNLGIKRQNEAIVEYWQPYIETASACGYKLLAWNVWNKMNMASVGMYVGMFPILHEFIFVFGKKVFEINKTVKKNKNSIKQRGYDKKRLPDGSMVLTSTGDRSQENKKLGSVISILPQLGDIRKIHPALFPVELPKAYIEAMTDPGDVVIDPFGGGGTTLIACEETGRSCRMMEYSPDYCDVIRKRYEDYMNGATATYQDGCYQQRLFA